MCGSGVGCIVFPPLMGLLLSHESPFSMWQSTLYIVAGLFLQCCITGALLRPPPQYVLVEETDDEESDEEEAEAEDGAGHEASAPKATKAAALEQPVRAAAAENDYAVSIAAAAPVAPTPNPKISVTIHEDDGDGEAKEPKASAQVHRGASTHSGGHAVAFVEGENQHHEHREHRTSSSRRRNPEQQHQKSLERLDNNLPIHSAFELHRSSSRRKGSSRLSRTPSTSTSDSRPVVYSVMDMRQAHAHRSSGRLASPTRSQHSIAGPRHRGISTGSRVGVNESAPIPLNPMNRVDIFFQGSTANLMRDPSLAQIGIGRSHNRHNSTHADDVSLVASRYLLHQSSVIASARNLTGSSYFSSRSLKSSTSKAHKSSSSTEAGAPAISQKNQTTDAAISQIASAEDAQTRGRTADKTVPPRNLQACNSFEEADDEDEDDYDEEEVGGLRERVLSLLPPSMRDVIRQMSDFTLLKNPAFLVLFIANFFGILGYAIPFVFGTSTELVSH